MFRGINSAPKILTKLTPAPAPPPPKKKLKKHPPDQWVQSFVTSDVENGWKNSTFQLPPPLSQLRKLFGFINNISPSAKQRDKVLGGSFQLKFINSLIMRCSASHVAPEFAVVCPPQTAQNTAGKKMDYHRALPLDVILKKKNAYADWQHNNNNHRM